MTPLELEEMTRELREARPEMNAKVAAELDEWAAKGFARPNAETEAEAPRKTRRGWLAPAFAGGCALLLVGLVVGVSQTSNVGDDSGGEDVLIEDAPRDDAEQKSAAGESVIAPEPVPPGDDLRPGRDQVQAFDASLTLSADADEVANVSDGVVAITDRYEGFVVSSDVSTGDDRGRASFDLRIPSQSLQAALADLSDLAHVKSRDEGSRDITDPFVTAEERFDDARARVDSLLEQLAAAGSPDESAAIRAQLDIARAELASARAQLSGIKEQAGFSTVTVAVVAEGDGPGWSLGEAADDAGDVLEWIAGALLVSLAVLVPAGVLGAALWFATASLRRRRRESVLDD